MSDTVTQRLLAAVLDGQPIGVDLVRDLARSSEAHGELVRLAGVLAGLPGDGARAAEARLDRLFDEVSLVAADESTGLRSSAHPQRSLGHPLLAEGTPIGMSADLASARSPGVAVHCAPCAAARVQPIKRGVKRPVVGGLAAVAGAAAVVVLMVGSRLGSDPPPTPARRAPAVALQHAPATTRAARPPDARVAPVRPAMVDVEVRVSPATAQIAIDGKDTGGNPFSSQYASDGLVHHVRASAPGYIAKSVAVMFTANLRLDVSLERSAPEDTPRAIAYSSPPVAVSAPHHGAHLERRDDRAAPGAAVAGVQPNVGKLAINTNVTGCQIAIDDVPVGETPLGEPIVVGVGRRKVTVIRAGYLAATRFVDVSATRTVVVELSLTSAAIDASAGAHPARPIDPSDPYGAGPDVIKP